jgi:ABC-type polysaccharide/polyol phosphate transport system ATPase subunit
MAVISCQDVSKTFRRHLGPKLIRHHVTDLWKRQPEQRFYALKNVTFNLFSGESLAVIGGNGAGKSTLLSLITGLAEPDEGKLTVNGRVAALLELGSGFHPDLTGAENVRLNAALLGFTRKQTDSMFDEVIEFAGLSEFIHEALRTYSSGMVARLAFSVAVNLNPDILIIDEVLTVGDQAFQAKCSERIQDLRRAAKALVFVSHSPQAVLDMCDRAIWLDHGELVMQGPVESVLAAYQGRPAVAEHA